MILPKNIAYNLEMRESLEVNLIEKILNNTSDLENDTIMEQIIEKQIQFVGFKTKILLNILQDEWRNGNSISTKSQESCIPSMISCMSKENKVLFGAEDNLGYGKYIEYIIRNNIPKSWKDIFHKIHILHFRQSTIDMQKRCTEMLIKSHKNLGGCVAAAEEHLSQLDEHIRTAPKEKSSLNRSIKEIIHGESFDGETLSGHIERVKSLYDLGLSDPRVIHTSYPAIDSTLGGIYSTNLLILAARPSMGKTALSICIANNIINSSDNEYGDEKFDRCVLFFSLEMSAQQLIQRAISVRTQIGLKNLIIGNLDSTEFVEIYKFIHDPSSSDARFFENFIINTKCNKMIQITLAIKSCIEELKQSGKKLSCIFIDYLQLIIPDRIKKDETKNVEISNISRQLKMLSMSIEIPIICLSQLTRGVEYRANKQPQLSDLRDSGSIEQDADQVILLTRPDKNDPESHRVGECDIFIAKNRQGETGTAVLSYAAKTTTFLSMPRYSRDPRIEAEANKRNSMKALGQEMKGSTEYDPWIDMILNNK